MNPAGEQPAGESGYPYPGVVFKPQPGTPNHEMSDMTGHDRKIQETSKPPLSSMIFPTRRSHDLHDLLLCFSQ